MGSTTSRPVRESPPSTPASALFNIIQPPRPRPRNRHSQLQPCPRRSIFAPDENEPDDIVDTPHEGVLVGWSQTESGHVIPQIRSIPLGTPLDDTIFNSPRIPWRERAHSPVPSARSIPRLRQLSIDSLRSNRKRELRVINGSRPPTAVADERKRSSLIWPVIDDDDDDRSETESFDWQAFPAPVFELAQVGGYFQGKQQPLKIEGSTNESRRSKLNRGNTHDSGYSTLKSAKSTNGSGHSTLKRGNSTNDSGYSTMVPDNWSCSDVSSESVLPWWWEEAAGYTTFTVDSKESLPPSDTTHYLHHERQESAYLSKRLRAHPDDEWDEWRTDLTNLLQFSIPDLTIPPPVPPKDNSPEPPSPRSPRKRQSLLSFARRKKKTVEKRKSVLW